MHELRNLTFKSTLSNLYIFGYLILLISSIVEMINIKGTLRIIAIKPIVLASIALGLVINLIISFLNQSNARNMKLIIFLCILVLVLCEYIFHVKFFPIRLIILIILLLNINVVNINKFINIDLSYKIIIFALIGLMGYLGIIPNFVISKGYAFGFTNSNVAGGIILGIILSLFIWIDYHIIFNNSNIINFKFFMLICFIIIIAFSYFTECRGLLYSGSFCLIFISLYKIKNIYMFICKHSMIITVLIFIMFMLLVFKFNLNNIFIKKFNKLLSNRLLMQSLMIKAEPLKLVGQPFYSNLIDSINLSYFNLPFITLDNSYLAIGYHYGIIGLFLVEIVFLNIIKIASRHFEYVSNVLLISLSLYAGIEGSFLSVFLLSPMLYSVALASHKK